MYTLKYIHIYIYMYVCCITNIKTHAAVAT